MGGGTCCPCKLTWFSEQLHFTRQLLNQIVLVLLMLILLLELVSDLGKKVGQIILLHHAIKISHHEKQAKKGTVRAKKSQEKCKEDSFSARKKWR